MSGVREGSPSGEQRSLLCPQPFRSSTSLDCVFSAWCLVLGPFLGQGAGRWCVPARDSFSPPAASSGNEPESGDFIKRENGSHGSICLLFPFRLIMHCFENELYTDYMDTRSFKTNNSETYRIKRDTFPFYPCSLPNLCCHVPCQTASRGH